MNITQVLNHFLESSETDITNYYGFFGGILYVLINDQRVTGKIPLTFYFDSTEQTISVLWREKRQREEKRGGESPLSTERRQFVIISISASAAAAAGISAAAFLMPTISRIYMPQSPSFLSQHSNVKSRDFELFHNFFFFFVTTKLFKWID